MLHNKKEHYYIFLILYYSGGCFKSYCFLYNNQHYKQKILLMFKVHTYTLDFLYRSIH